MTTDIPKQEILDGLIYITTVLFVLSVITEKATQLVRSYSRQCQILAMSIILSFYILLLYSILFPVPVDAPALAISQNLTILDFTILLLFNSICLFILILNLPKVKRAENKFGKFAYQNAIFQNIGKQKNIIREEEKEKEIGFLSFGLGFILAYAFNASLLELFINPNKEIGWNVTPFINGTWNLNSAFFGFDPTKALGFIITGFFLSFGSKFFHDLLDMLLQIKNFKRKLNDDETYNVETIQEFDDQLALVERDMVKSTYEKLISDIMKLEGVVGASCGYFDLKNKKVYGIKVFTSSPEGFAEQNFYYDMPNGTKKTIPLQITKQLYAAKVCSMLSPSDNTRNKTALRDIGSLCFAVKDRSNPLDKYLLTCYHVVKGKGHSWNYFTQLGTNEDKVIIQKNESAEIRRGVRSREIDAALIVPDAAWSFSKSVPSFGTEIKVSRPVYYSDDDNTVVNIYGAFTKKNKTGVITGVGARHKIDFDDGTIPFEMVNLLEIQHDNRTIVDRGDSGSLVFTDKGEALGMVLATTEHATLAIPIDSILRHWNIELDT